MAMGASKKYDKTFILRGSTNICLAADYIPLVMHLFI